MNSGKWAVVTLALVTLILLASGCTGSKKIKVEYLPGFETQNWFGNNPNNSTPKAVNPQAPTIAVNSLWDERSFTEKIGDCYNKRGEKVATVTADRNPTTIIEAALIKQLQKAGFTVIQTSGWNLSPDAIPDLPNADFILGGKLKLFWVEAHPGFSTVALRSNIAFDLVIADIKSKRIIWAGQFVGTDTKETAWITNAALRDSLSRSLTQAVNKVFQDQQARTAVITLVKIKF